MDSSGPSGLPRPASRISRLPQRASLISPTQANSGIARSSNRNSVILDARPPPAQRPESAQGSRPEAFGPPPTNTLSPRNKRQSMLIKPGFFSSAAPLSIGGDMDQIASVLSPPPPPQTPLYVGTEQSESGTIAEEAEAFGMPEDSDLRPSLADRTAETLSQIPPSPSPGKRRQSGFFTTDSPMRPPSRAASALGHNRGESRNGLPQSGSVSRLPGRAASPTKPRSTTLDMSRKPTMPAPARRIPGARNAPPLLASPTKSTSGVVTTTIPRSKTQLTMGGPTRSPVKGTTLDQPTGLRASSKSASMSRIGGIAPPKSSLPARPVARQNSLKPSTTFHAKKPSLALRSPERTLGARSPSRPAESQQELQEPEQQPPAKSSEALRESIRAAKAARRSLPKADAFIPRAVGNSTISSFGQDVDPVSLDLLDSSHVNIIRKRVNNARSDGKLNLSALCLTEMPVEVLKMYDSSGDDQSAWYEAVDVTKFYAADNEFTSLPETLFQSPDEIDENGETGSTPSIGIFLGLENIDIHGNQLVSLPRSLGNLSRLTSLNLSRNKLAGEALDVISRLESLKELRLAENGFKGSLSEVLGNIETLEILDLHGNALEELPSSLGKLSRLRVLDVASNRLASLPFESIFDLPITEIHAAKNRLSGELLTSNILQIPSLQVLDVSVNALNALTEAAKLDMPALRILNISYNRISILPEVKTWGELTTFNAEENKISELPLGFTALNKLQTADFSNNSLLQLDHAIGTMDNLQTFRIANNPIRERRLIKLSTQDLKREFNDRIESAQAASASEHNDPNGTDSGASAWKIDSDGTVDRSNAKLAKIERPDIAALKDKDARSLLLHHNSLEILPSLLSMLGSTLTNLDLSHNKLGKAPSSSSGSAGWLTEAVFLPQLQTLNLTSNALTDLEPLVTHLSAPRLSTLILSFNRLSALPIRLSRRFPDLSKLLAPNNRITVLDVEAVRGSGSGSGSGGGVQVLDLSSNELEYLPPKLALLQGRLRTLMVGGNKFRVPGWGVLEKGTEEILAWCRKRIPAGEEGAATSAGEE